MTRPVVVVLDRLLSAERAHSRLDGVDVREDFDGVRLADVIAIVTGPRTRLDRATLDALVSLKVVAGTSAGHDHLPLAELRRRGVWVTAARDYCVDEVADHTLALVVDLLRQVSFHDRLLHDGGWRAGPQWSAPRRLAGTALGLVGFGRTGKAVARRAVALGMAVTAFAPTASGADLAAHGVRRQETLLDLLGGSDVVSLHVPLSAETRGLFDATTLAAMRPGAMLVNVSRGEIVDEKALTAALASGRLAGAALDVFADEPLPASHPLRSSPRAVLTPHIAWWSEGAAIRGGEAAADAVAAVLRGERPAGAVVDPFASRSVAA